MSTIMLFGSGEKSTRPATEIIKDTIGFEQIENVWYVTFSTIENRKGYGRQRIPVNEFAEVVAVLQDCANNGIHKEDEVLTCSQVVKNSIIQAEDGSVRFKTEGSKGKKPTLFTNMEDFSGAVEMLASVQTLVEKQAKKLTK